MNVARASLDTITVGVGSRVRFRDESDEVEQVVIVADEDADFASGRISSGSPIARALLGHAVGDPVRAWTPGGMRQLRIISVEPGR